MAKLPFNFFNFLPDVDNARLDDGRLFIGETGKMPTDSPVKVWLDNELTIPAPPYLLIKNGFMWHNGDVIDIYLAESVVSLLLLDVYRKQLIYIDNLNVAEVCGVPAALPVCTPTSIYFSKKIKPPAPLVADIAVLYTPFYQTGAYIDSVLTTVDTPYQVWDDYVSEGAPINFIKNVEIHPDTKLTYDYGNEIALKHKLFFYSERELIQKILPIMKQEIDRQFDKLDLSNKTVEKDGSISTLTNEIIGYRSEIRHRTGEILASFRDYTQWQTDDHHTYTTEGNGGQWLYPYGVYSKDTDKWVRDENLENYFDYEERCLQLYNIQKSGEYFSTADNIYPYNLQIPNRVLSSANINSEIVVSKVYQQTITETDGAGTLYSDSTRVEGIYLTVKICKLTFTHVRNLEDSPVPLKLPN